MRSGERIDKLLTNIAEAREAYGIEVDFGLRPTGATDE